MEPVKVFRVKRKASEEPADALVIALKKPKLGTVDENNEVYLKFATTIKNESDVVRDRIQEAIAKDKLQRVEWGKNPKATRFSQPLSQKLHVLHRAESQKRREALISSRRLILMQPSEDKKGDDDVNDSHEDQSAADDSYLFKLYDIIEENEEAKPKQLEMASSSSITCNGIPLVKRTTESAKDNNDYVYDVYYIANGNLDERFVNGCVSVQSCVFPEEVDLVAPSEEPEECYEDEDDSNDEDNWRNDYPDEDSDFEKNLGYYSDCDYQEDDEYDEEVLDKFKKFGIDPNIHGHAYAVFKTKILSEVED